MPANGRWDFIRRLKFNKDRRQTFLPSTQHTLATNTRNNIWTCG